MHRVPRPHHRHVPVHPSGVTAIESLLAVAIVSIAGGALLSALASAVQSSREIALITIARGLADQLLAEVGAAPVSHETATPTPSGPRRNFTTSDHFHGWTESPPQDRHGRLIGTEGPALSGSGSTRDALLYADAALLSRFRRSITVEKVQPEAGVWNNTSFPSFFRRISVRIDFTDDGRERQLAVASCIICNVAPAL